MTPFTKTFLTLATLAVAFAAAGCQLGRRPTAGEQMVNEAADAPQTDAPRTAEPVAATRDDPARPTTVAGPASPATTPATMASATRPARLYVAADADEATRFRNWPPVVNGYPSGNVIAGPVYRIIAPPPRSKDAGDVYAVDLFQTFLTVPQMLATPFWMFITPPNTAVEYHGEVYPPSYTLDDPLPYYQNEKVPGILEMKRDK